MTIPASWVETRPVLRGDKILSTPLDALRQNSDRTYYTRLRTLFSAVLFAGNLGQVLTIVRTSKASSRKIRVSLYFAAAGDADVELETLNGSDTFSVTVTRGSAGLEVLDIDEAWIADDTSYYFRVLPDYGMGVSVLAVEAVELDGEEAVLAGIATIWPDCADATSFQVSDVRVGDLQTTLDTGDQWQVQSLGPTVWERWILADRSSLAGLPTSDVVTDAYATVLGLPYVWNGSDWVSSVVTISSWASRPLGASAYDGMWGVTTAGRVYRYFSSGGPGEWIDPRVYETATYRAKITGNVVPASETPAWSETADGGGSISTDGTRVTFNGDSSVGARAFATLDHGQSGATVGMYVCGYVTASGTLAGQGVSIWAENGVRGFQMGTGAATGNGWLLYPNLNGTAATAGEVLGSGTERWVELRADANGAQLWVDHRLVGWRQAAFFDAAPLTRFAIGEVSAFFTRGILLVRELSAYTYTI